jgi:coproporphyrinogen III oxidase
LGFDSSGAILFNGGEVLMHNVKKMFCKKHGETEHYFGYKGWECEKCFFEYFHENENENIQIMSELNINEVGF